MTDTLALLVAALLSEEFVAATLSGVGEPPARVTVRPVTLAAGPVLQFTTRSGRHSHTENLDRTAAATRLEQLLRGTERPQVYLRTLAGDLQLSWTRAGEARLIRHRASTRPEQIDTAHDRARRRRIPEDAPFLRLTGISDAQGRVKPTARAKYRQVEQFLEILDHTLGEQLPERISVVDLGCGAGVLTLAAYHELALNRGITVDVTGVDRDAALMDRLATQAAALGWQDRVHFLAQPIAEFTPAGPVDLVLALHACDTATDDALAQAVHWQARWILVAPCCHHDLQAQMDKAAAPPAFAPLLRHGILTERLGDLLTDSLRAELLRAAGYRAEVIEFVSTEHTARNLMIRATRTGRPDPQAAAAADALAAAWGVSPALALRLRSAPPAPPAAGSPSSGR